MRYTTVVFDLDGTLVDSYQALTTALNRLASDFNLPGYTTDQVRDLVGEGVERLLEKAFGACTDPLLEGFNHHYGACLSDETVLLADVAVTLDRLHEHAVAMSVCTNKPTAFSETILENLGIRHYFAAVSGPDVAGARKPDPAHILHAMNAAGGAPDTTLMVGDMVIDVRAARAAGCAAAAIATGSSSADELREARPDYLVEHFTDLVTIVCATGVAS